MIPVASTVIPLEDLPEYTVGLGFGINKDKKVSSFQTAILQKNNLDLLDLPTVTGFSDH